MLIENPEMAHLESSLAKWSLDTNTTPDMLSDIVSFMKTFTATKMGLSSANTWPEEHDENLLTPFTMGDQDSSLGRERLSYIGPNPNNKSIWYHGHKEDTIYLSPSGRLRWRNKAQDVKTPFDSKMADRYTEYVMANRGFMLTAAATNGQLAVALYEQ